MRKIDKSILAKVIKPRDPISYKGNYGRILIIAGSIHFGGAAILSSSAAVYSGAGLVTVATTPEKFASLNTKIPEAMTIDYHDQQETLNSIKHSNVIVIGPGLGISELSQSLIKSVIENTTKNQTIIFDASALTEVSEENIDITSISANVILTPHQGEWQRLSELEIPDQTTDNNLEAINKLAPNSLLIVKKHLSEIYYHNNVSQIKAGNAGMATGGMGDTLTGVIAAFVGQFGFSEETVAAALFLHSYISDSIYEKSFVVLPEKLISEIPLAMKSIIIK
ncbi:NAD(P)H-hydrate dehydratase [Companilactobacillus mishanensis]|uniref:ADP-dependent (S)-NAD(P)H-hydrate dehydratase n=1 Tax=Companilactobacillus mishanensis TaxID=2486008 RepID=A0A5P0ZK32_9LACO|nr:NAD(P)H-hydrate dehydratase [Companilactobacillus mishanensis]MQS53355.1 NAD(P)H-hydrate dehydratase [Companilactobacillus mishanensis]